jgi:hypothetical protein
MGHSGFIQAARITTLTLLVSGCANLGANSFRSEAPPSNTIPTIVETDIDACGGRGDVFQLDDPGTYTAFAVDSSGRLSTEVRGSDGERLATSHPTAANTTAVDLPTGLRFGIAPPQLFEVELPVTIHVRSDESSYELFVVRIDGTGEFSGLDVRPPVERVIDGPASCLIGNLRETYKIHTQAVHSDTGARQVFAVHFPNLWDAGSVRETV